MAWQNLFDTSACTVTVTNGTLSIWSGSLSKGQSSPVFYGAGGATEPMQVTIDASGVASLAWQDAATTQSSGYLLAVQPNNPRVLLPGCRARSILCEVLDAAQTGMGAGVATPATAVPLSYSGTPPGSFAMFPNPADLSGLPGALLIGVNMGTKPLTYADQVLLDGPLAYWKMDDTGSTVVDSTGHGHDGTYLVTASNTQGAPAIRAGAVGSLKMTANTGGATMPSAGLQVNSSTGLFTIEYCAQLEGLGGSVYQTVVALFTDYTLGYSQFRCTYRGSGRIQPNCATGQGTSVQDPTTRLNQAIHVCFIKDSTLGSAKLYINGTQVDAISNLPSWSGSTNPIVVGGGATAFPGSYGIIGRVSDIAIYDYPLSASRVLQHAQAGGFA